MIRCIKQNCNYRSKLDVFVSLKGFLYIRGPEAVAAKQWKGAKEMKKIYEAPEAILTGFEAAEMLANGLINFDTRIALQGSRGVGEEVEPSVGDIPIVT